LRVIERTCPVVSVGRFALDARVIVVALDERLLESVVSTLLAKTKIAINPHSSETEGGN